MEKQKKPASGEFYRDRDGKFYQIRLLAKSCRNGEECVVYQEMFPPYRCWVQDIDCFLNAAGMEKYPAGGGQAEDRAGQAEDMAEFSEDNIGDTALRKALKSGQPEKYLSGKLTEEEIAMRGFMQLLDAETFHEKRQIFIGLKQYLDERMLSNIAVALDIVLEEGSLQQQYESVLKCLEALERYEGGRLR